MNGCEGRRRPGDGVARETPADDSPTMIRRSPGEAETLRQIQLGFMFTHSLLSDAGRRILSAATAAFALADLLVERGVLTEKELKSRRDEVGKLLVEQEAREGLGLFVNDEHQDKYALAELPTIDCATRLHLCRAACCLLRFPLSRQDVEEGVVRWDFGRPYWNLRDSRGYCVHNDPQTLGCRVYGSRPGPCRLFDCREDRRIWVDFAAREPNPELAASLGEPAS